MNAINILNVTCQGSQLFSIHYLSLKQNFVAGKRNEIELSFRKGILIAKPTINKSENVRS